MSAVRQIVYQLSYWCDCVVCGTPIYGAQANERARRKDGQSFFCINGHSQFFRPGKSQEQILRERLEKTERERDAARARETMARNNERSARHGAAIARGKLKAQLERIANGVCPCCRRSFSNVRRHMASKHPSALDRIKAHERGANG